MIENAANRDFIVLLNFQISVCENFEGPVRSRLLARRKGQLELLNILALAACLSDCPQSISLLPSLHTYSFYKVKVSMSNVVAYKNCLAVFSAEMHSEFYSVTLLGTF